MPDAWSKKDERQYIAIRKSAEQRGKPKAKAKEIAARTVNKQRRKENRTPNRTTQGTGNPNVSLEQRTVRELQNLAKAYNIKGRGRMRKKELCRTIRNRR